MPFGLTSFLAIFYNLMNNVLYEYPVGIVVIYSDDIFIYSMNTGGLFFVPENSYTMT